MRVFACFLLILSATVLSACGRGNSQDYLRMYGLPTPSVESFSHCYDYGCKTRAAIVLPDVTRKRLKRHFTPPPKDAKMERQRISTAIKIFESDIGAITGTKNDKRGTFRLYQDDAESTKSFQQDCIDESTNTTIYMTLLEQMELVKFHRASFPANRQPFLSGAPWWHQTAVIEDLESGDLYALDSWFKDNGSPAFTVPLKEWKDGWLPPKS